MSTIRLEKAATYIETMLNDAIKNNEADQDMIVEAQNIIEALRATIRTDLDKGVWASVFPCIGIKTTDLTYMLSNILTEEKI